MHKKFAPCHSFLCSIAFTFRMILKVILVQVLLTGNLVIQWLPWLQKTEGLVVVTGVLWG